MIKNIFKKQLIGLGFSDHEADIYLVLLENGHSSTGPIIKKTNLHRNIVYETLNKLVNKKFVSESNQRGIKHYKALNPEKILHHKEEQFNLAQNLIPQLKDLQTKEKVEVVLYEGLSGFQTALKNAIDRITPNQNILVLATGGEFFYKNIGNALKYYDKKRKEKKINIKMIYQSSKNESLAKTTRLRPLMEVKYIESPFLPISEIEIMENTILMQIYSDPPVVIEISSKEVADSYRNHFTDLWEKAEK
ncbi:MAG: hypothetical protein COX29_04180 [Candidatus Moranbacteria bacterium CG23_combo_of_CG06-09_8_20_14_all_35_22]|nr:MAG: hypothetical protein COX29_04180 [Candidatus Moranbacteria bacterium CG23_combo_of_CG06-09_8_20_14_all_35_22]